MCKGHDANSITVSYFHFLGSCHVIILILAANASAKPLHPLFSPALPSLHSEKGTFKFNLLSLPLPFPHPVIQNMKIKREKNKTLPMEGKIDFSTNSWSLFMENTSHSTNPRYLIRFSCGCDDFVAGCCGFLSISFFYPPFNSVPTSFPFLCVARL